MPGPFPLATLRAHAFPVTCVEFHCSNEYLVSGDEGGWCILWSILWRRPIAVWKAHTEPCLVVKFVDISGTTKDNGLKADTNTIELLTHGRDFKFRIFRLDLADVGQYSTEIPTSQSVASDWKTPWMIYTQDVNSLNFCSLAISGSVIAVPHTLDSDKIDVYDIQKRQRLLAALAPSEPAKRFEKCDSKSRPGEKTDSMNESDNDPKIKELSEADIEKLGEVEQLSPSSRNEELDLLNTMTAENHDKSKGQSKLSRMFANAPPQQHEEKNNDSNSIQESQKHGIVMSILVHQNWLVAGYENGSIAYYDISEQAVTEQKSIPIHIERVYDQPVLSLSNVVDGTDIFYSTSAGPYLTKHKLSTHEVLSKTNLKHVGLGSVCVRNDAKIVAMTSWDGFARVVKFKDSKPLAAMDRKANCVAFASVITTNSATSQLAQRCQKLATLSTQQPEHWLAVGSKDGRISLYNIY